MSWRVRRFVTLMGGRADYNRSFSRATDILRSEGISI
jgi:hypothetical protein